MSGYLERLVARAGGGAPAAAAPRVPSRFEPNTIGGPTDAAAWVPSNDDVTRDGAAPQGPRSPERSAASRADERIPEGTPATSHVSADRSRDGDVRQGVAATRPTGSASGSRPIAELAGSSLPRLPATVAARVAAIPPHAAVTLPDAARRGEASGAARVPDVVHITIDRVEVRATVAAPTASSPRAPQRRDAERSLHDYLTGRSR